MNNEPELGEWTSDWQAGGESDSSADAIRLYAQGRRGFMLAWALSELTAGAIALPLVAYLGWVATDQIERWAMWLLALMTVSAMCVWWWNWQGSLLASVRTTAEYLTVSTERLRRMRQACRMGWFVLIAAVAIFSVWIWNRLDAGAGAHTAFAERFSWGLLAIMTLSAVAFLVRMDRWIRRDAANFEELKRELEGAEGLLTFPEQHPPTSGPGHESRLRAKLRSGIRGGHR